jgi:ElaB/YqjD/DUF883 family membrane-anchored ribosome-binding protein
MENVENNSFAKQGQALADKATPYFSRVAGQAQAFGKQSVDAAQASDSVISYTQENPVKALLIAAASGALLLTLINAITPSRD